MFLKNKLYMVGCIFVLSLLVCMIMLCVFCVCSVILVVNIYVVNRVWCNFMIVILLIFIS